MGGLVNFIPTPFARSRKILLTAGGKFSLPNHGKIILPCTAQSSGKAQSPDPQGYYQQRKPSKLKILITN
jgi:hypothetical protein